MTYKVRILAATGTETDVQEDNKNNLINTKDSQIPVHQIGTMQQKSVFSIFDMNFIQIYMQI
jgi:hypothetical protein